MNEQDTDLAIAQKKREIENLKSNCICGPDSFANVEGELAKLTELEGQ